MHPTLRKDKLATFYPFFGRVCSRPCISFVSRPSPLHLLVELPHGKIHLQVSMSSGGDSSDLITKCGICLVVELVGGKFVTTGLYPALRKGSLAAFNP